MVSPNQTFTELATATLRHHKKKLTDNVSKNNALLARMQSKGKTKISGGLEIVVPLEYAENATYQRYSGYDTLNIQASDVLSAAKFDWKQIAVHVTANGLEIRKNMGSKEQIMSLVDSRVKNAIRTFNNNFSLDLYSDGTAANQINGLQALIADAGTGTIGGINSSTWTFWKNVVQSAAAPLQGGAGITPSATTIQSLMLPLWLELTRGGDKPDLIMCSNEYYTYYEDSLTDLKRYTGNDNSATGGFTSLKYKTADVVFDGGSKGGGIPAAHMYFMNTDYIELFTHPDADMTEVPEMRSLNQDAVVIPIIWQGNLAISNRSLQGVLKA